MIATKELKAYYTRRKSKTDGIKMKTVAASDEVSWKASQSLGGSQLDYRMDEGSSGGPGVDARVDDDEALVLVMLLDVAMYMSSSGGKLGRTSALSSMAFRLFLARGISSLSDSTYLGISSPPSVSEPAAARFRLCGVTVDVFLLPGVFFPFEAFCLPSSSTWHTFTGTSARRRTSIQTYVCTQHLRSRIFN